MVILLIILLILLLLLALCEFLIHFALDSQARWTLRRALYPPERLESEAKDPDMCWLMDSSREVLRTGRDGLRMSARLIPGEAPHRWIICCHGYCNAPTGTAIFARHFHARGFTVLAPSLRAHADSEGRWIGMGWPDRLDLLEWTQWVLQQDAAAEICWFGMSMGASTVCMAAGENPPPAVRCVISESAFTSVWDEYESQMRRVLHIPVGVLLWLIDRLAAPQTGWHLKEASTLEQVKKASVPILFAHGGEDRFVPFTMLDVLYEACTSPVKEKLLIPGAGHCQGVRTDPQTYWKVVDAFMDRVCAA